MEEEQKKLKNINGTLILFHVNVYLLSSPKHKHDAMLLMQLSSCLQKKNTQKLWTFTASLVANFFFFFLFCPTSFCIGLLYTYIFETCKHRQGQAIIPGAMLSTLRTECVAP